MDLVLVVALIAGALAVALCSLTYHLGGVVERRRSAQCRKDLGGARRYAITLEETLRARTRTMNAYRSALASGRGSDPGGGRSSSSSNA